VYLNIAAAVDCDHEPQSEPILLAQAPRLVLFEVNITEKLLLVNGYHHSSSSRMLSEQFCVQCNFLCIAFFIFHYYHASYQLVIVKVGG